MSLDRIAELLAGHAVRLLPRTSSTNDAIKSWADAGAPHGAIVVAREQTQGRGRQNRRWFFDPFGSLAMSIWWRADVSLSQALSLPLVVGLGVWRALRKWSNRIRIKWPNDLLAPNGAKLAGILIERGMRGFAIGIGVNVRTPSSGWPALDRPAMALDALCTPAPDRAEVAAAIVRALDALYPIWQRQGFAPLHDDWWLAHGKERAVRVRLPDRVIAGRAIGIADDGALLVAAQGAVQRITIGEVEGIG